MIFKTAKTCPVFRWRRRFVTLMIGLCVLALYARLIYLGDPTQELAKKLNRRATQTQERTEALIPYRGNIEDRNGNILAMSTPVLEAFIDPTTYRKQIRENYEYQTRILLKSKLASSAFWNYMEEDLTDSEKIQAGIQYEKRLVNAEKNAIAFIADKLSLKQEKISDIIQNPNGKRFFLLKKHVDNLSHSDIDDLKFFAAVFFKKSYKRYYPRGKETSQLVGLTNIDGKGIEGIELAFEQQLHGKEGRRTYIQDRLGKPIQNLSLAPPIDGKSLRLSIDQGVQYYAYQALEEACLTHQAAFASAVVIDAKSGEIIAVTNYPSFNPNHRNWKNKEYLRNKALIHMYEMGSVMKPFIVAKGLEEGYITKNTKIDTTKTGYWRKKNIEVRDSHGYGLLDIEQILVKSSNIGIAKTALMLTKKELWETLRLIGFGDFPYTGFPGETKGKLNLYAYWSQASHITASYGYGYAVSLLQVALAYTTFANDGWMPYPSLIKTSGTPEKTYVFSPKTSRSVRDMLTQAVRKGGTGYKARVQGYTVAGKTGTARLSSKENKNKQYIANFVGLAPATNPKFVVAVMIGKPSKKAYYAGEVAAPVFSQIMGKTLAAFNVPRDGEIRINVSSLKGKGTEWMHQYAHTGY